jgi:hypothetical protein
MFSLRDGRRISNLAHGVSGSGHRRGLLGADRPEDTAGASSPHAVARASRGRNSKTDGPSAEPGPNSSARSRLNTDSPACYNGSERNPLNTLSSCWSRRNSFWSLSIYSGQLAARRPDVPERWPGGRSARRTGHRREPRHQAQADRAGQRSSHRPLSWPRSWLPSSQSWPAPPAPLAATADRRVSGRDDAALDPPDARHALAVRERAPNLASAEVAVPQRGLICKAVCQVSAPGSVLILGQDMVPCFPLAAVWTAPAAGVKAGRRPPPEGGLVLMPARTTSPFGVRGRGGPWGRGRGQRVVARRVVEADMRGLVTAGPSVRLERWRGSKNERRRIPLHGKGFGCS